MQAVVLPYNKSKDLKILLDLARRLKIPFQIKDIDAEQLDDSNIIFEFQEPDEDWVNLGMSSIDDDWECPEEWVELSKQTVV